MMSINWIELNNTFSFTWCFKNISILHFLSSICYKVITSDELSVRNRDWSLLTQCHLYNRLHWFTRLHVPLIQHHAICVNLIFYNQSHNNAASSHPQNLTIDTCFLLFYWMPFMSFWYCNVMTWPHTRRYKIKYESDVGKWK